MFLIPVRQSWRALSLTSLAAALLCLCATAPLHNTLHAQETTGGIRGTVIDAAGAPVAGATVTAVNVETGLSRSTAASSEGSYIIRLLPSGTYRVLARRIGNVQDERSGIRVVVGTTATVNFVLRDAAVTLSAVQVSGVTTRIDARDGGLKQGVSTEEISNLPTLGRDFTDFINLSGLVSPTPETTTGGQFSIAGARPSQTNVQLDGADANNSFFGENRGGSRIPFNFSIESVKEFQIVTNGFDVEYGNYSGGIINIISKGGTNRFRATGYGNYRGEQFTRKNFDGTTPNDFNVQQYALQVEGPVIQDKLFYFASVDAQRRREPFRPVSPTTLRSQADANAARALTFTSPDSVARYNGFAATDRATADSLTRFYSILENKYGVSGAADAYNPFFTSNDVLTAFARVDWNIDGRNRLSVRNSYSDYNNANETFGATSTGGLSKVEAFKNRTNSLVSELTSTVGKIGNVLRMQYSTEERPRVGSNLLPELRVNNVNAGRQFAWGGASVAFRNRLEENKFQIVDNMSATFGTHNVKVGTNNLFAWYQNDFWLNGSGIYTFDNLAALEAGTATRYTRNVRADGLPPTTSFSTQDYSAYVQDEWQTTPRLTTTLGVRYDVSRFGKRPGRVVDAERGFGIESGIAPIDKNNISPRIAMAWDRKGDASEVFRGGVGLFYGRIPAVLGGNVGITDVPLLNLDCAGSAAEGDPTAPPTVTGYTSLPANGLGNPTNCAGTTGIGGLPEYSFWSNGFELPQTLRSNIGYERALGERTRVSADFLLTETSKLFTVRNINLRPSLFALANEANRLVFVPASRFAPANAGSNDRLLNTDFGNIYVNEYDGQASSQALTFNVDHRLNTTSSIRGSYTWQRAYDNSSLGCCTSFESYSSTRIGAAGPNNIGGVGDTDGAWGPSGFVRNHTFVLSGFASLPLGFRLSGVWRLQGGTPWSPEQGGDLNADGLSFNDRPFIFAPDNLPVSVPTSVTGATERAAYIAEQRARYGTILREYECVGDYVGRIIERNTCRQPWFNRLDMSIRNRIPTRVGQSVELSLDLFNVLNGLNSKWGRYEAVSAANRNLVTPVSYDATNQTILYTVPANFGQERTLGANLLLQFSAQLGVRYTF
ncbi:MAG TPA: carboxypeptidase regulatory-like domain-containing protein [Gemmatimonas sp.]|nr:carboxypeptidase regulatory-like domain-containing protein [Gemmatimonas sp.]